MKKKRCLEHQNDKSFAADTGRDAKWLPRISAAETMMRTMYHAVSYLFHEFDLSRLFPLSRTRNDRRNDSINSRDSIVPNTQYAEPER